MEKTVAEPENLKSEIAPDEILIRSVRNDDLRKGKPHWRIFRPRTGSPFVSVMRGLMGADFCKDKSKEIAQGDYAGMAALTVSDVLATGALVHDDQEGEYPGHAHIDHIEPAVIANDPSDPLENAALKARCITLVQKLRYYHDQTPAQQGWSGQNIV